ncbi:MAG: UbiX family flavin prenyltransferase [Verrucomicrobia bacterium]|nr:UbiX family flavin prenyltransferase [Verrucomicrobiota bacterium]
MARIVVGVSGASGTILAHRLIQALSTLGHNVELIISRDASLTILKEMGEEFASPQKFVKSFSEELRARIRLHHADDFSAPIASGSYRFDACVIVPCSMATLAAISTGLADNLLRRAADVALKEKRRLVLVPREAPFNEIHLENMLKLSRMGAVVFPPIPAWYMLPQSLEEMEQFMISRLLDQLGIVADIMPRWGES